VGNRGHQLGPGPANWGRLRRGTGAPGLVLIRLSQMPPQRVTPYPLVPASGERPDSPAGSRARRRVPRAGPTL